ncbi:MAG TPA: NAD(P)H-hydrate dehydratase, partial [Aggregatilineales bacterium]|nr:NAD(P)H-hydrate dehydratase [Aggregatilineales bacterium]
MIKIATVEEMKAIEAAADKAGVSYAQMMDAAGRAVADRAKQIIEDYPDPRVVVLVGPGNNGGDGLVAGRLIAQETRATVTYFLSQPRDESDENYAKVRALNALIADGPTDAEQGYRVLRTMISNADLIVDALLGTGTRLPIKGDLQKVMQQIHKALADRKADRPHSGFTSPARPELSGSGREEPIILAVDMPTGLNADTGEIDKHTLYADETVTLETAKIGHVTFVGADAVGVLHVASLGLPEKLKPRDSINRILVDAPSVRPLLPQRPASANKGTFGKAMIVGGSVNYIGAPALSAQAAYRVGAGLVTVAAPQMVIPMIAAHLIEATWVLLPHDMGVINEAAAAVIRKEMAGYTALLIGPGLGQEDVTKEFMEAFLVEKNKAAKVARHIGFLTAVAEMDEHDTDEGTLPPLVVDADGLNLLAKMDEWWTRLPARTVLTPHPGEMARLTSTEDDGDRRAVDIVQADRLNIASESAAKWNCVVVLKGAHTVIADPDGRVAVIPFANAALARAGTGDVLAGAIVGYLAQGLDPFDAAVAAAYIHGYAGEMAASFIGNKASVLASDVVSA